MDDTVDLIKNQDIIGQSLVVDYLRKLIVSGNHHQAYLVYGPQQVGKRTIGQWFIQQSLCSRPFKEASCRCQSCHSIKFRTHPDFIGEMSENVQANIGVDEIRQLINRIQQKPTLGSKVMALIPNIERLSEPAMNSLLKTLEEPPGRAVIVMTTSRIQNILPTLRSRCHLLRCSLVSETVLSNELQKRGADRALAKRIAAISNGAPGTALHWIADQAEYMKTEKDLSGIADLRKSSRMGKIRFIKDNCSGNEVAQQREFVKTFSDHWLQIEREQLSGSIRTTDNNGGSQCQGIIKSTRSIRRALQTTIELRKNFSPTLLLESLLINYEQ